MKDDDAKAIIEARVATKLTPLLKLIDTDLVFWVAGGALIRDGNDVDLFRPNPWPNGIFATLDVRNKSANARTAVVDDVAFQF